MQGVETAMLKGNGTETGQIIATTIGGRNGQPKQVILVPFIVLAFSSLILVTFPYVYFCHSQILISCLDASYSAICYSGTIILGLQLLC